MTTGVVSVPSSNPMPFEPVRVAVLGSCVSRDLFNSRFNPNYKDLFECVALSNQVSLISLMSGRVDVPPARMGNLDPYGQREVTKEVTRSFLDELLIQRPGYLLIDLFADVHFGCFSVNGSYLTRNRWKIMRTPFFSESDTVDLVPGADRAGYLVMWRDALDRLLAFLGRELPETRLVLHRARNVTRSVAEDGSERSLGREAELRDMNDWWETLDAELSSRGVDRVINVFTDDLTSTDSHPWGPFAVHYTLDYHPAALTRLTQIVLADVRSAADGTALARSVPSRLFVHGRARLGGLRSLTRRRPVG
ncbi:hypothetical protein SAMN05660359_02013 [Geodermatophilus obscurus]|uniref:Uncharacterized protein n=1 Tax=Geodermatophilus obscurus TaxID=1861 RepID=A0A1I5F9W2_9ACTN|nr:DUF6270 domain-containing protein [Geodermatophilus obscurus]SFO20396.1 hypothetical protein SAMN05660359_02013 [Geodermatophilus obscurus]